MRENGTYVDSVFGSAHQLSIVVNHKLEIAAGTYFFLVDPVWNEEAKLSPQNRDVLVQLHCQEKAKIESIDFKKGLTLLAESLKHFACNTCPPALREFYLQDMPDVQDQIWRIQDATSMNYAFVYTQNNSKRRLVDRLTFSLQGYEVLYPEQAAYLVLDIAPGCDEIVILRKLTKDASFELESEVQPFESN